MAAITALTENFEGGTAGASLSTANSIFDFVTTPAPIFVADSVEGTRSMGPSSTAAQNGEKSFTGVTTYWSSFYLKITANATSNTAIYNLWGNSAANKVGDVQVGAGGSTLRLRSVNTLVWTSATLTLNQWHRIEVGVTVDSTIQLKIYSGANLHTTTVSQQSGAQSNTGTVATNVDEMRMGMLSADTTLGFRIDRHRADNATAPAPIVSSTDGSVAAVTATATAAAVAPAVSPAPSVPLLFHEGGEDGTPGTSYTTADSDFTAFSGVGTIVCRTTQFVTGTKSIRVDTVADGNLAIAEWIGSVTNPFVLRAYFRPANLPVAGAETEVNIMEIRGADNTVKAMVEFTEFGNISIKDGSSLVDTSATELNINEWTRMEWRVDDVLNTQSLRLFVGANVHGTVPDETITGTYTRDSAAGFWIGVVRKALVLGAWWDEVAVANDWIGPANVTSAEVTAVTATATASAPAHVVSTDDNTVVVAVTATAAAAAEYPGLELEFTISGGGPATASALAPAPAQVGDPDAQNLPVATAAAMVHPPAVTGSGGVLVQPEPAMAFATPVRETIVTGTYALFEMPSHEEPMRTKVRPLNRFRLHFANSLVRINGNLTVVRHPTHDQIRAAGVEGVDYFVGGHRYPVTEAIAQELTLLGYEVGEE